MDLNRLTLGDKVIGGSGVLLFIFSFFKWLGYSYSSLSVSQSAWSFTLCWLAVIIGILLVGYVVLKAMDVKLPALGGVTWNQVVLALAAIAFLFIVIKLIAGPSAHGVNLSSIGVSKSRKVGIFLGAIASAGMVVGAYLNASAAGELPGNLGRKQGGTTPPPPPVA
jgi:hypothetical protein